MILDKESYAGEASQHRDRSLKQKLFIIIFGTHTPLGRLFDILLLIMILLSMIVVMLESVDFIYARYSRVLTVLEWVITISFTAEYAARIWVVKHPRRYIFSFYGVVDLLSVLPSYLVLVLVGGQSLAMLRALRLLRIFRVLKLAQYMEQSNFLLEALKRSRQKITVFFLAVLILVFIMGSIMYLIEGTEHGFNSIPRSVYWAIVTLTTVGYGDISPGTITGQFIASILMLLGYSIIAIPTGIVGSQIYAESQDRKNKNGSQCSYCHETSHLMAAKYCHQCGQSLHPEEKGEKSEES